MPMTKEQIEAARTEAIAKGGSAKAAREGGGESAPRPQAPQQGGTPTSRLTLARAAIRPAMKGRVMLSGPPGAGKTYTALTIATILVGPDGRILVVDSEKESSLTYADVFRFEHLPWNPPFDPTSLSLTLKEAAADYDAIIVDSFSHWWRKKGGVLDIAGDHFRGWKDARPVQEDLIETILDVDAHVIVCCRSKMEHAVSQEGGKTTVTKLGIKAQQDDDLEYEVNVALEVDMSHVLHVAKSRTNAVPVGSQFLSGLAGDFAQHYREWLQAGEPVASKDDTDWLAARLNEIPDEGKRRRAKAQFLAAFGRPEFLLESRLADARVWVVDALEGTLPVDRAEDAEPPADELEVGDATAGAPIDPPPAPPAPPAIADAAPAPAADPPPSPDATAETPPSGQVESEAIVAASSTPEGSPFNGDTGLCDQCGGPIWYAAGEDDGGPAWLHADEDDDAVSHERPLTPAAQGVDVDALYGATHGRAAKEAQIRAEVAAMTPAKVIKAMNDAKQTASGTPKQMRDQLVEYRLAQL